MEEPAVQQEKIEGLWEGGQNGGKADWKNEGSLSSFLKHSCFLCWSSPRETDAVETDERVITKAAEIRELENALAMEKLDLQEQQSDRQELEETLVKLEKHKDKLIQQIKSIRQLCYNESQQTMKVKIDQESLTLHALLLQILSLQADEMQKESQVEEYEWELARARWRLKKLREEVKQAKRKADEAGERNNPLEDSIRQSYEEILQEERTLCSLSGGAVTPDSQLNESASPADTTEEDSLPMRPWGRSQSLPAYADLIMRASSFGNNLASTREEVDDSGSSSSKMDRSYIEDDPEEREVIHEVGIEKVAEKSSTDANPLSHMDFYQADPFSHCQNEHDLFDEDLFPKTDSSDGFASDPFKGSDPFAADILFPKMNISTDDGAANNGDEADTSVSCAENRASTGTQCFESEFPDEDSDIEISYSREDLDTIGVAEESYGFKPIQSSSEELGAEGTHQWRSQFSVESDPNGYELDLGAISPPSDIEEQSLASTAGEVKGTEQDLSGLPVVSEPVLTEPSWIGNLEQTHNTDTSNGGKRSWNVEEELGNSAAPQNVRDSQTIFIQPGCELDSELSIDLSYEATTKSSFDPYGFKLSPEHSHHSLLDPDEEELSPQCSGNDIVFVSESSPSQPETEDFPYSPHPYVFGTTSSQLSRDSDPYGFKLSPEPENQEDLKLHGHTDLETMDICTFDRVLEVLEVQSPKNPQTSEHCDQSNPSLPDLSDNGCREAVEPFDPDDVELIYENQEVLDLCSHENQEVVGPFDSHIVDKLTQPPISSPENREVLELESHVYAEFQDFRITENLISQNDGNQEVCRKDEKEVLSDGYHDNQDVLEFWSKDIFPEANNNQCVVESKVGVRSTSNSSDSDVDTRDLLGLDNSICTTNRATTNPADGIHMDVSSTSSTQGLTTSNAPSSHHLLEGDLGSVFGAGGYIGCPDVADDLEPLGRRQTYPLPEPVQPVRPVRPPRPSLRAKEKAQSQTIDLK